MLYLPVEPADARSLEQGPRQDVGDWENDAGRLLTLAKDTNIHLRPVFARA
jgi:hypothetical protein